MESVSGKKKALDVKDGRPNYLSGNKTRDFTRPESPVSIYKRIEKLCEKRILKICGNKYSLVVILDFLQYYKI